MNLLDELKHDMIDAMKSKDQDRLTVIRMVKAALDKERIDKKIEITDDVFLSVVQKQIKMRNDSISEFQKANRLELVEKTEEEIQILKKYLPEPLTEEEVLSIITEAISKTNASSIRDMSKVMSEISPKVKGRYDMKAISDMIKSKLS